MVVLRSKPVDFLSIYELMLTSFLNSEFLFDLRCQPALALDKWKALPNSARLAGPGPFGCPRIYW
jgi:hypothetical protein